VEEKDVGFRGKGGFGNEAPEERFIGLGFKGVGGNAQKGAGEENTEAQEKTPA